MLRNRFLILLGVCFLAASAAWADDMGYVDCSSHSEGTQVFGKPRKTPDVVANLSCGERFTILVYGFYFSRIQTKDGQVGYIYSNLIALDHGAASVQQAPPQAPQRPARPAVQQEPSLQMATEKTKIPRTPPIDADSAPAAPTQPQTTAAPVQPEAAPAQPAPTQAPVQPAVAPTAAETSPAAAPVSPGPAANAQQTAATPAQPNPPAAAQPQPESVSPSAAPSSTPEVTSASAPAQTQPDTAQSVAAQPAAATSNPPEASTTAADATPPAAPQPGTPAAQPEPAAAQPEPAAAQPAPAPIRPADKIETWEKPRPGARTAPLIELYGGYAFARVGGVSNGSNLNGALGSFGWNPKSWLQVVADTSYSFQTVGNTKNVLYGNHFGPRFFYRARNRWGLTPFVEGLVGGSSERTTISGTGGSTSSTGSALSYKVGGGIDIHPSRRWDVRLFDVDYYRTTFGAGTQQNNYWISAGVVLRILGGSAQ